MRILFDRTDALPPSLYRRFLRRAVYTGCMAGTMSSTASYLSLNALLLSESEVASLAMASSGLARAIARAADRVAEDVDQLVAYGFPWTFAELLAEEPSRPIVLGRFDFILDLEGRWRAVEYNSDTPSGIREATAVDEAAFDLLGRRFAGRRANDVLISRLVAAFAGALPAERPLRIGFLTDAAHLEDMGQMVFTERLVREEFGHSGVETILGDVHNLAPGRNGRVSLTGQPIDALYRYYPFETMLALPQFSAIVEAVARGRLCLLNGLRGLLLQNKGLLAWVWAHRADPLFSEDERAAIERSLPPTWWIRDLPDDVDRSRTVVKQVFGREGEEVYFGNRMSDDDWRRCREWGTFVVQERVESRPLDALSWDWQGRPILKTCWPSVGSFVAAEEWAGCYVRLGDRILTSQAEFVPTFVENG